MNIRRFKIQNYDKLLAVAHGSGLLIKESTLEVELFGRKLVFGLHDLTVRRKSNMGGFSSRISFPLNF